MFVIFAFSLIEIHRNYTFTKLLALNMKITGQVADTFLTSFYIKRRNCPRNTYTSPIVGCSLFCSFMWTITLKPAKLRK